MDIEARNRIEKYLVKTDFRLIDFIIKGDARIKYYEIYIDGRNNLSIDELAKVNSDIRDLLESKGLTKGLSNISVSSPGVDRPFKYIWQLYKHVGRTFDVKLNNGSFFNGILEEVTEADENTLRFKILKKGKNETGVEETMRFSDIIDLKVKLKFK
jgi:ribosome maturation factor RimP